MRKLLIGLALLAAACNSGDKKTGTAPAKDTLINPPAASPQKIEPVALSAGQLPASLRFTGTFHEAWQWTDKAGEHILLTYYSPLKEKKDRDGEIHSSRALFAAQYDRRDTSYGLGWQHREDINDCMFDLTCEFITGSSTITDLDKNGIGETKVQYATACRSDVSPAFMRLVMQEGGKQYILQGSRWLKVDPKDVFRVTPQDVNLEKLVKPSDEYERYLQEYGRYESEKEFRQAPAGSLEFAKAEWLKFAIETIGE